MGVWLIVGVVPAAQTGAATPASGTIHFTAVTTTAVQVQANLISNPSFEETTANGVPVGWQWDRRNTDAICVADHTQAHRGRQSLFLTNGTAFGAHVYGMLWRAQPVRLAEGKPYTMSAWIRSDAPGIVSLVGGADWQFREQARARDECARMFL